MAARVVCVASARGGSGRTTLAAAFGAFLAASGRRVLPERHRAEYDYVFLDAPAGTGARVAIDLSDDVVIVSEPGPMAAAGVERLRALLPDERRTRVLVNKAPHEHAGRCRGSPMRERARLLRVGVVRSVAVFVVCFALALAFSLAVTAPHVGLRVAGYIGFAVLLVLAFVSRRFVLMRGAIEENDRAIAELEGRRADHPED